MTMLQPHCCGDSNASSAVLEDERRKRTSQHLVTTLEDDLPGQTNSSSPEFDADEDNVILHYFC